MSPSPFTTPKRWITRLFVFFILVFPLAAGASNHIVGTDITYRVSATNDSIYEVTLNFYRNCNGCYVLSQSPYCGTGQHCSTYVDAPRFLKVTCVKNRDSIGIINLSRTSISDITITSDTMKSSCAQPCTSSYPYGVEKHVFKGTLDLRDVIKGGCCAVDISIYLEARSSSINTGHAGEAYYNYARLNACLAPGNSSPEFTADPISILCCNTPIFYNDGALDRQHDSLSYSVAPALKGYMDTCTYTKSYSYRQPFSFYDPFGSGQVYPNALPPIGFYLDPETGDKIFTLVGCGEIGAMVIEIKEWRRDSAGVMQIIGITRRDLELTVANCPANNPPIINGPYSYSVCAGEKLCFNITTDDKVFVPPPPLPKPDPDTVTVSWNEGIDGADFSITDSNARLQTGRFCWTPSVSYASDLPYSFTVRAQDNNLPKNAVSIRSFQVRVKFRAQAEIELDTLTCGEYEATSTVPPDFKGTPRYLWQLLDSNGDIVFDNRIGYWKSTKIFRSTKQKDTLQFRTGGTYIIRHEINNAPNCPSVYFDTLVVPPLLEIDMIPGPDTFVCTSARLDIKPKVKNGIQPFSYDWTTGDTTAVITFSLPVNVQDSLIRVDVTDGNGCTAWDTTRVFLKNNPKVDVGPDRRICTYDFVVLGGVEERAFWDDPRDTLTPIYQGDTLYKQWFYKGSPVSTDSSYSTSLAGDYRIRVTDSLGCFAEDTMILFVNDTVTANAGPDQLKCLNDTLILYAEGLDTTGNGKTGTYRWYDITSSPRVFKGTGDHLKLRISDTMSFLLHLYVTDGATTCFDEDTVNIRIKPFPQLSLPNNRRLCCDDSNVVLNADPPGGQWYDRKHPEHVIDFSEFNPREACNNTLSSHYLTYVYQDSSGNCRTEDSFRIDVNPLPKLQLKDGVFCQRLGKIDLEEDVVYIPAGVGPIQEWNCVDCGTYDWSDILVNLGNQFFPDYALRISKPYINLDSVLIDSIRIEMIYGNPQGCFSRDTATITIVKEPQIRIGTLPELCWNNDPVNLITVSGVTPNDGRWVSYDTISAGVIRVNNDSLNGALKNNILDPKKTYPTGGRYYLRYNHNATGCNLHSDAIITIREVPQPEISESALQIRGSAEPYPFCHNDDTVHVSGRPVGGTFHSVFPGAISGNIFNPRNAGFNTAFPIIYSYTDSVTTCTGYDSVQVIVGNPTTPVINRTNDKLVCSADSVKYIWFLNGNLLPGESGKTLELKTTGNYTVMIIDQAGCSALSSVFVVDQLGISNDLDKLGITIHPVPAGNVLMIDWSESGLNLETVKLLDTRGRIVLSTMIDGGFRGVQLDLQPFTAGTYYLELGFNSTTLRQTILIQR